MITVHSMPIAGPVILHSPFSLFSHGGSQTIGTTTTYSRFQLSLAIRVWKHLGNFFFFFFKFIYFTTTLLTKGKKKYIYIYTYSTLPYLHYLQKNIQYTTKTLQMLRLHYLLCLTSFIHFFPFFSFFSLFFSSFFLIFPRVKR